MHWNLPEAVPSFPGGSWLVSLDFGFQATPWNCPQPSMSSWFVPPSSYLLFLWNCRSKSIPAPAFLTLTQLVPHLITALITTTEGWQWSPCGANTSPRLSSRIEPQRPNCIAQSILVGIFCLPLQTYGSPLFCNPGGCMQWLALSLSGFQLGVSTSGPWQEMGRLQESEVGVLILPAPLPPNPRELLVVNWVPLLPKATVLLDSPLCPFRPDGSNASLAPCCCLGFPILCLHRYPWSLSYPSLRAPVGLSHLFSARTRVSGLLFWSLPYACPRVAPLSPFMC